MNQNNINSLIATKVLNQIPMRPASRGYTQEHSALGSIPDSKESSVAYLEKMLLKEQMKTSSQPTIVTGTEINTLNFTLKAPHNVSQDSQTINHSQISNNNQETSSAGFLGNTLKKDDTLTPEQFEQLMKQIHRSQNQSEEKSQDHSNVLQESLIFEKDSRNDQSKV